MLSKDIKAIQNFADLKNIDTPILNAILAINDERPKKMVSLCEKILGDLKAKKITILGLTFKPDTDDIRSSPSLDAINLFLDKHSIVSAYDPMFKNKAETSILPKNCNYCMTMEESLNGSDAVLVFTKWSEFESLDSKFLKRYMNNPILIDGRGFLDKEKFESGTYFKIGYSE